MSSDDEAHVLVVAHKTAATPVLLDAVRERAARGPCRFTLLVPNGVPGLGPGRREQEWRQTEGAQIRRARRSGAGAAARAGRGGRRRLLRGLRVPLDCGHTGRLTRVRRRHASG